MNQRTKDEQTLLIVCQIKELARELEPLGVDAGAILEAIARPRKYPNDVILLSTTSLLVVPEMKVVRLNPAEMTLYDLYLHHPEGIPADDLVLHWKELCATYRRYTVHSGDTSVEDTMESLCSESKMNFYAVVSRIKRKIIAALGDEVAQTYYIRKKRGGTYSLDARIHHDEFADQDNV